MGVFVFAQIVTIIFILFANEGRIEKKDVTLKNVIMVVIIDLIITGILYGLIYSGSSTTIADSYKL